MPEIPELNMFGEKLSRRYCNKRVEKIKIIETRWIKHQLSFIDILLWKLPGKLYCWSQFWGYGVVRTCLYFPLLNRSRNKRVRRRKILHNPLIFSDPARIQTWNLLIRSQILYSVELRGQCVGCKCISAVQKYQIILGTSTWSNWWRNSPKHFFWTK